MANQSLQDYLNGVFAKVFAERGFDEKFGRVRVSDRPDLADFQCNGALALAKAEKKNPREIAADILARLEEENLPANLSLAGPGFINIKLSDSFLGKRAAELYEDELCGAKKVPTARKVVIDFGGPNVAKPMHVGHLRSSIIGDSLQRLHRFLGDEVTSDVHLGDWGLQMGHLITELEDEQAQLVYFDENLKGPYPDEPPVTIDDLARLYPQAAAKAKEDEARHVRSQKATAELQAGRAGYRALLKHFISVSVKALKDDFADLGVHFDLWKGESDVDQLIAPMAEELKAKKIAIKDEGAWIIPVERDSDKKDIPPFILYNSRGGTGYHATDLATILDRKTHLKPDLGLYVVDQRQALHFEQVFRASTAADYIHEDRLKHIGFGTMNGVDGKPFKTREGGVMRLRDLIDMARNKAREKMAEAGVAGDMPVKEQEAIVAKVALAALRFSDLSNVRTTNYAFNLDEFMRFEGTTGPYLLYAAVRIKSLLHRAENEGLELGAIRIESEAERNLVLQLDRFAEALNSAYEKSMPHHVCDHVYALAQGFSALYGAHAIASEKNSTRRGSRLALSALVLRQLELGLDLIGVEIPDRM